MPEGVRKFNVVRAQVLRPVRAASVFQQKICKKFDLEKKCSMCTTTYPVAGAEQLQKQTQDQMRDLSMKRKDLKRSAPHGLTARTFSVFGNFDFWKFLNFKFRKFCEAHGAAPRTDWRYWRRNMLRTSIRKRLWLMTLFAKICMISVLVIPLAKPETPNTSQTRTNPSTSSSAR